MAETLTPLVYEGPIDTVRTPHGEVARGGILHVPEGDAAGLIDGGLFRAATDADIAAAKASSASASDPSSAPGGEPSLSDPAPPKRASKRTKAARGKPDATTDTTIEPPANADGSDDAGTAGEEG